MNGITKSLSLTLRFILVAAMLTSCAGKPHREPPSQGVGSPPVFTPVPSASSTGANSTPIPPPVSSPIPPPDTTVQESEAPHIALVLGGAGVASFATVGLLKRFQEEGIKIDYIVSTGWPTLFALGSGFLKSVHDVEWFAMRLQEKDFYKAGLFNSSKDYSSHDNLSALIQNSFPQTQLETSKIPIIISATNTELGDAEIYDKGDWKTPLLKTMSVPGLYRPYPQGEDKAWINSLQGMDVEEAARRGAKTIVAVEMYEDYFTFLRSAKKESSDSVFRRLYLGQLKRSINRQIKDVFVSGHIVINASPNDFSSKRVAIFAGYKEGARLAHLIRTSVH